MKFFKYLVLFIAFLVGISIILIVAFNYIPPSFSRGYLKGKEIVFYNGFSIPFYMHIIGGIIALFCGIILFCYDFQYKFSKFHKKLGSVYIIAVLVLGAVGGFAMSFFAKGGFIAVIGFLTLSILWFYTTFNALKYAKKQNFIKHKLYITRSFLLTLAAPLLRIELFINNHWQLTDHALFYTITAWISWAPQLLIYEYFQYRKKTKKMP